jgi:hypothetical protein
MGCIGTEARTPNYRIEGLFWPAIGYIYQTLSRLISPDRMHVTHYMLSLDFVRIEPVLKPNLNGDLFGRRTVVVVWKSRMTKLRRRVFL